MKIHDWTIKQVVDSRDCFIFKDGESVAPVKYRSTRELIAEHTYLKAELADVQKNNLEAMDDIARLLRERNSADEKVGLYEAFLRRNTNSITMAAQCRLILEQGTKL